MERNQLIELVDGLGKVYHKESELKVPTREQVEKAWRGEWTEPAGGYADGDIWECSECGYMIDEEDGPDILPQFCPNCYAAMTDKAVDIVMERLEALYETE